MCKMWNALKMPLFSTYHLCTIYGLISKFCNVLHIGRFVIILEIEAYKTPSLVDLFYY